MTSTYLVATTVGAVLLGLGLAGYYTLYSRHRDILRLRRNASWLFDLISHIPDKSSGPGVHVLSTVLAIVGTAVFLTTLGLDAFSERYSVVEIVAIAGFFVTCAFSTIAVWTLWQTRRLAFESGYQISDFHDLVTVIGTELYRLDESFSKKKDGKAHDVHRVYLVSTQPFLGQLSFPKDEAAKNFREALTRCIRCASDCATNSEQDQFRFHLICGSQTRIHKFHENYFGKAEVDLVEKANKECEDSISAFEDIISSCTEKNASITRVDNVPNIQFMVVGNKLFEFTLDSGNSLTEIFNTQVITDNRYCLRYIEYYDFMKSHLSKKH